MIDTSEIQRRYQFWGWGRIQNDCLREVAFGPWTWLGENEHHQRSDLCKQRQAAHRSSWIHGCSVAHSCPTLRPHGPQHARPPCPSLSPGIYSNSCPLSWWCHPTISSSVIPFSSCPQSFPASGSFPIGQLFALAGQSIRAWIQRNA